MTDESLSAEQVAAKVGLSPATVRKLFAQFDDDRRAGVPPMQRRGIPCYQAGANTFRAIPRAIDVYQAGGISLDVDPDVVREQVAQTTRDAVRRLLEPVVERLTAGVVDEVDRHLKEAS